MIYKKNNVCWSVIFVGCLSVVWMLCETIVAQAKETPLIIGGREADVGAYPFIVELPNDGEHGCGGTLIDPEWVMTAVHCVLGDVERTVVIGRHDLTTDDGVEIASQAIYVHPDYQEDPLESDIALIHLSQPAAYDTIQFATDDGINIPGVNAMAIGWGRISTARTETDVLHEVGLRLHSTGDCNEWGYDGRITEKMICAGYKENGRGVCYGDSGGPLFVEEDGVLTVVGVTSWVEECGYVSFPPVFVRVSAYSEWIQAHLDGNPPNLPNRHDLYEPDNLVVSATVITDGDVQTHTIDTDNDKDWMTFTLTETRNVVIHVGRNSRRLLASLYDSEMNSISHTRDIEAFQYAYKFCDGDALEAGSYYISVLSYVGTAQDYTITLDTSRDRCGPNVDNDQYADAYEPDNTVVSATMITVGDVQAHTIIIDDDDWFTFTLTETTEVIVFINQLPFNGLVDLFDAGQNRVDYNDNYDSNYRLFYGAFKIGFCGESALEAGTYTMRVRLYNAANALKTIENYQISLDAPCTPIFADPDDPFLAYSPESVPQNVDSYEVMQDDSAAEATPLLDGILQPHTISPSADSDWMTFTLTNPAHIEIATSGAVGDTMVWLYTADQTLIYSDDDGGDGMFSRIVQPCLPVGTYLVKVQGYFDTVELAYDIVLDASPCDEANQAPGTQVPLAVTFRHRMVVTAMQSFLVFAVVGLAGVSIVKLKQINT